MKIDRHGRAKILTPEEIQLLFSEGFKDNPYPERDRALFGVCLYTACRINEACTIKTKDVYIGKGVVRDQLMIRKNRTKGKLATRTIPIIEELRILLANYFPSPRTYNLFTGRRGTGHIHPDSAAQILRESCIRLGLEGVSTHSFRRTALTQMSNTKNFQLPNPGGGSYTGGSYPGGSYPGGSYPGGSYVFWAIL